MGAARASTLGGLYYTYSAKTAGAPLPKDVAEVVPPERRCKRSRTWWSRA